MVGTGGPQVTAGQSPRGAWAQVGPADRECEAHKEQRRVPARDACPRAECACRPRDGEAVHCPQRFWEGRGQGTEIGLLRVPTLQVEMGMRMGAVRWASWRARGLSGVRARWAARGKRYHWITLSLHSVKACTRDSVSVSAPSG